MTIRKLRVLLTRASLSSNQSAWTTYLKWQRPRSNSLWRNLSVWRPVAPRGAAEVREMETSQSSTVLSSPRFRTSLTKGRWTPCTWLRYPGVRSRIYARAPLTPLKTVQVSLKSPKRCKNPSVISSLSPSSYANKWTWSTWVKAKSSTSQAIESWKTDL